MIYLRRGSIKPNTVSAGHVGHHNSFGWLIEDEKCKLECLEISLVVPTHCGASGMVVKATKWKRKIK